MGFIGVQPTSIPLTSSDITDGIISTAKIADNAVTSAKIPASAITGNFPTGSVLQTITAHSNAHTESASHKFGVNEIVCLTANITPSATNSKILIMGFLQVSTSMSGTVEHYGTKLFNGSTEIGKGDTTQSSFGSSNTEMHSSTRGDGSTYAGSNCIPFHFTDSPTTTSQVTYNIKGYASKSTDTGTFYLNRGGYNYNSLEGQTATSNLTLMEIKG